MYRGVAIGITRETPWETPNALPTQALTPSAGTRRCLWTATRTMTARAWPNISSVPASISRCTTCCPAPTTRKRVASARKAWRILADWHDKYHLLHGMTFDFWHPHDDQLPLYRECLEIFRGKGLFLACEDTPLNARTMEKFAKYLTPEDDVGILIDLGHMNVRQWMNERHEPEDFLQVFQQLPMKVRELHLHDNKGRKDEHREVGYGNLPMRAVVDAAKAIGFDGIVTLR